MTRSQGLISEVKEQYRWGHISQREYLKNYTETGYQLKQLTPGKNGQEELERLAHFLANVADGWREANQKQRNKLARALFEEIRLDSGGKVVAVKPRPELEPFFDLHYQESGLALPYGAEDRLSRFFWEKRPRGDSNP